MANENRNKQKRDRGRELAIDGILYSRFGERPCAAAERALQALRSPATASAGSGARPATRRKRDAREPRRRFNGGRKPAASVGRGWPTWTKVAFAAAAVLLLLLTVRFVVRDSQPDVGGVGVDHTERVARPPENGGRKAPDESPVGSPSGKDLSPPDQIDPGPEFARQLAWTKAFDAKGSPKPGRGGLQAGGSPQEFGGGGPAITGGSRTEGGIPRGAPKVGGAKGGIRGGRPEMDGGIGAPPKDEPKVGEGADVRDLQADIDACVRKLSFKLRIPEQLPGDYRLTALTPDEAGDGVMLLYTRGGAETRVFVSPSVGPDTPFRKVELGKRALLTARRGSLLIAVEGEPPELAGYETWAALFVSP